MSDLTASADHAGASRRRRTGLGRVLDLLYLTGGYVSALALIAIVTLIAMKWGARVFGVTFSVGASYAGYAMATASFMAFAYTLNNSAHIRVTLGLNALGRRRFWGEAWCFALGGILSSWIAYEAFHFAHRNWERGRLSSGADATPLWIPQAPVVIGSVLLALCFWDNLVTLLRTGRSNMVEPDLGDGAVQAEV